MLKSRTVKRRAAPIKLLKVEPVKGYAGEIFHGAWGGTTRGQESGVFLEHGGSLFLTKVMADNVEYHERKYDEKRVAFGSALSMRQGRVNAKFTAPEDFGEVHDLYAVIDGEDAARGGFRILRSADIDAD